MTVRFTHKPSKLSKRFQKLWDQLNELQAADDEAAKLAIDQNARLKFDPSHRLSHYVVTKGRIEIGSRAPSYARLLLMDGAELTDVYRRHILGEGN
jgi:hypothetical protein